VHHLPGPSTETLHSLVRPHLVPEVHSRPHQTEPQHLPQLQTENELGHLEPQCRQADLWRNSPVQGGGLPAQNEVGRVF